MKKILAALTLASAFLLPGIAFATPTSVDYDGTYVQPLTSQRLAPIKADSFVATNTNATSTFNKTDIVGSGVRILGEYFTNFTTYVRSLFSASTGLTYSAGQFSITNTGVSAASYTNANITVNAQGQITAASNGSAGSGSAYPFTPTAAGQATSSVLIPAGLITGTSTIGALNATSSLKIANLSGVLKATSGTVSTASNGTDYTLISALTCSAGQFFQQVTASGTFTCGTPSASGGGSGFTFSSNFGRIMAATTSPIWAQSGIYASSTSQLSTTTIPAPYSLLLGTATTSKQSQGGGGPETIGIQRDNANNAFIYSGVTNDIEARWLVQADGLMGWGAGGASDQDVNLFRNAAGNLTVQSFITNSTDAFRVNNMSNTAILDVNTTSGYVSTPWLLVNGAGGGAKVDVVGGGGTAIRAENAASSDVAFSAFVTGDAQLRFSFLGDGTQKFGSGAATADTQLLRTAAGSLGIQPIGSESTTAFNVMTTGSARIFTVDTSNQLASTSKLVISNVPSCSGTQALTTNSSGTVACGTITGTGGGNFSPWATTTSQVVGQLNNYSLNSTDIVNIGSNSTTTSEFWFDPNTLTATFGNGGTGDATEIFGPTSNTWAVGYDDTDKSFAIASSSVLGTLNAITIAKNLSVTLGGGLFGASLSSCSNGTTDKLLYNSTTGLFSCGTDQTGGGGGVAFPFTPFTNYNATTTVIGFNGLFSTASSTFNGPFRLPALSAGGLAVDSAGLVYSGPTSTLATISGTLSPSQLANSDFGNFTCAAGVCTIDNTSVTNAMLANSTISGKALGTSLDALTATNGSLTFSGSYDGSTARTVGINLANRNDWTAYQTFASLNAVLASTTNATTTGSQYFTSTVVANSSLLRTDSAGKLSAVTIGSGVAFDGTTLTGTGGAAGVQIPSWTVKASGGDYTTIQAALDKCGLAGGGNIALLDTSYSQGGTGLRFKGSNCHVFGRGVGTTTINFTGATTYWATNSAAGVYSNNSITDLTVVGDSNTSSIAFNLSDMTHFQLARTSTDGVGTWIRYDDTQNISFYNSIEDNQATTLINFGINASSTNPWNGNYILRNFIGCGANGCVGLQMTNANGNTIRDNAIEPDLTKTGTVDIKIFDNNIATCNGVFNNDISNNYLETGGLAGTIGMSIAKGLCINGGIQRNYITNNTNEGHALDYAFPGTTATSTTIALQTWINNYNGNFTDPLTSFGVSVGIGTSTQLANIDSALFAALAISADTSKVTNEFVVANSTSNRTDFTITSAGTGVFTGIMQAARVIISGIAAAFTPSSAGEIGIDTTDNQLKYFSSSAVRVLSPVSEASFTVASTSPGSALVGTTTVQLGPAIQAQTWVNINCYTDTGTAKVSVLNGASRTNTAAITTTAGNTAFSTNNAFAVNAKRSVDVGTPTGSATSVSCTISKTVDAS